jgi:hypothetical protein
VIEVSFRKEVKSLRQRQQIYQLPRLSHKAAFIIKMEFSSREGIKAEIIVTRLVQKSLNRKFKN